MRRMSLVLVAALVAAAICGATGAMAANSAFVNVSANVVGTCRLVSDGSLTFTLDPAVAGPVSAVAVDPTFWCTRGASVLTFVADDGLHFAAGSRTMAGPQPATTESIPYSFGFTSPVGTVGLGPATPIAIPINGQVQFADFSANSAGTYTDTIVISITP